MKRRKLIILISTIIAVLFLTVTTAYAVFTFSRSVSDDDIEQGEINLTSQKFLNYAPTVVKSDTISYYIPATVRTPGYSYTVVTVTSDTFSTMVASGLYIRSGSSGSYSYSEVTAGSAFSESATYCTREMVYSDVAVNSSNFTVAGDIYTGSFTAYSGSVSADSVSAAYYELNEDTNEYIIANVSSEASLYTGTFSKADNSTSSNYNSSTKYYMLATYQQALKQRAITPSRDDGTVAKECYATERGGYSDEVDNIYLNQLGFEFTFQTNITVYMRIHISDAWYTSKYYTNSDPKKYYIAKDKVEGKSPFTPADTTNWVYDEATNCIYYKNIITPTSTILAENTTTNSFTVNSSYYYTSTSKVRESVIVQVGYSVDVVQANRAYKKWGFDPETLFS